MRDKFKLEIYERENGNIPFLKFYEKLDIHQKAEVMRYLNLLETVGNKIKYGYSKKLDDYIYELRMKENKKQIRVLYFFYVDSTIVVTHGFIKKSQKTPRNELLKANIYRNDWIKRR